MTEAGYLSQLHSITLSNKGNNILDESCGLRDDEASNGKDTPYDAFEHLWRSASLRKDNLIAMFTAYFDESSGPANAYSVAGYVATVEQWSEFERELLHLAQDEGYQVLHKADLENFRKEFEWPNLTQEEKEAKRLRINKRVCGSILRRVNAGFSVSVLKSDWEEVDKGRFEEHLGKSFYAAGAFYCMRFVSTWADDFNRQQPIRYVFERGAQGRDEVEAMLRRFDKEAATKSMYRLGGWSFEPKKEQVIKGVLYPAVVPLQAADFIAYETYKQMANRIVDGIQRNKHGEEIPQRKSLRCVTQEDSHGNTPLRNRPTPYYITWLRKERLLALLRQADEAFPEGEDTAL